MSFLKSKLNSRDILSVIESLRISSKRVVFLSWLLVTYMYFLSCSLFYFLLQSDTSKWNMEMLDIIWNMEYEMESFRTHYACYLCHAAYNIVMANYRAFKNGALLNIGLIQPFLTPTTSNRYEEIHVDLFLSCRLMHFLTLQSLVIELKRWDLLSPTGLL